MTKQNAHGNGKQPKYTIFHVRPTGNDKGFWTRVGVAFANNDGSLNLVYDLVVVPREGETLQLRDFNEKKD
jgi:hypothetical protein